MNNENSLNQILKVLRLYSKIPVQVVTLELYKNLFRFYLIPKGQKFKIKISYNIEIVNKHFDYNCVCKGSIEAHNGKYFTPFSYTVTSIIFWC